MLEIRAKISECKAYSVNWDTSQDLRGFISSGLLRN